jgi:hypothetical protein
MTAGVRARGKQVPTQTTGPTYPDIQGISGTQTLLDSQVGISTITERVRAHEGQYGELAAGGGGVGVCGRSAAHLGDQPVLAADETAHSQLLQSRRDAGVVYSGCLVLKVPS